MVMLSVLNNPVLTLQLGILGRLLGLMGRIVKGCVREVSLAQVSCILMYVYVAPPTPVGAWSMALGLRQRFECYYYDGCCWCYMFLACQVYCRIYKIKTRLTVAHPLCSVFHTA